MVLFLATLSRRQAGHHEAVHRLTRRKLDGLRQVADRNPRQHEPPAAVQLQLAQNQAHERGLARAVLADEADLVALADMHAQILEQRLAAEGEVDVFEADEYAF